MNPHVKAQWVAALRSGKYRQARERLRNGDRFCCLGVLCDLHAKQCGGDWDDDGLYMDDEYALPEAVIEWANLDQDTPIVNNAAGAVSDLAALNDSGASFLEIADMIEKQL